MDTAESKSYVSLSLLEIQQRFQELMEDEQMGLTLEEPAPAEDFGGAYNPYDRTS
jgi:hypothetical protein